MSYLAVSGRCVFITGGSKGLGLALALQLAEKGANIVLLARTKATLELAREKVLDRCKSKDQTVDIICVDLCDPDSVEEELQTYPSIPDVLICTAGGTSTEIGFFADIESHHIKSCMESNYLSAAYIAHGIVKRWIKSPLQNVTRHLVFTSSTAAFVGLPGYVAYTPTKVAVRALADTLRQELLLYGGKDMYRVHCLFPGTFISEGFLAEHSKKPELTKILEETNMPDGEMMKKLETADSVALKFVKGLEKGLQSLTVDFDGRLLLNNMRGMAPRDFMISDMLLGWLGGVALWAVQRGFDKKTRLWGIRAGLSSTT